MLDRGEEGEARVVEVDPVGIGQWSIQGQDEAVRAQRRPGIVALAPFGWHLRRQSGGQAGREGGQDGVEGVRGRGMIADRAMSHGEPPSGPADFGDLATEHHGSALRLTPVGRARRTGAGNPPPRYPRRLVRSWTRAQNHGSAMVSAASPNFARRSGSQTTSAAA